MSQLDDYLAKAQENLASCESELVQRRYNSCVRSAYYACFHAAIVALMQASVMPMASETLWSHDRVQAQFVGRLIQRRKSYPARLRRTLLELLAMRHRADYRSVGITQREARQAVQRAQDFVQTITAYVSQRES
jgi:uncharacterized protein (UPF0332 family)